MYLASDFDFEKAKNIFRERMNEWFISEGINE